MMHFKHAHTRTHAHAAAGLGFARTVQTIDEASRREYFEFTTVRQEKIRELDTAERPLPPKNKNKKGSASSTLERPSTKKDPSGPNTPLYNA